MLQLIISILLSLGLNFKQVNGKIVVDQSSINQVQSSSLFEATGDNVSLNEVVVTDDDDPNE